MSLIIKGVSDSMEAPSDNVEIIDETSHVILLSDPADAENYYVLPATINVQAVPVALITTEAGEKNQKRQKVDLPPLYTCETCNYTTSRLGYFEKHQLTHWVVKKNNTKNSKQKGKELVSINMDDSEFKCPHCNYFTSNYRSLRIHMHVHTKENTYRCMDCNFRGKNLAELISHHKQSKKMQCKYCRFSTHSKELFKTHKENDHAAKWFGCMKCKFAAADRSYLATHMATHHSKALRFDPIQLDPEPEKQI